MPKHFFPHQYQVTAIAEGLRKLYLALFLDPGLGKTVIVLWILRRLQKQKKVKSLLVVAPLRACYSTWPKEPKKWWFSHHMKVRTLHGSSKGWQLTQPADIYVINPEGLKWLFTVALKGKRTWPFQMLVVDESGKFRNPKSKNLGILSKKLYKFMRRMILNGTPCPNSLMDLWGQYLIVDRGQEFGGKVTHYRHQYFHKAGFRGYEWRINDEEAEQRIYKRASHMSLVMEAKDHLSIPEVTFPVRKLILPPKARKIYDGFEEDLFAYIDKHALELKNTAVASGACRQVCSGAMYHPLTDEEKLHPPATKDRKWHEIHDAKIEGLFDLIDELQGKPLLIAYTFHHTRVRLEAAIKKRYKRKPLYIGSGVSPKQGVKIEDMWNAKQLHELLGQPKSMSHSLNMQFAGGDICWFDHLWDLELYIQFCQRLARQGAIAPTRIHHLVMEDTVEEAMLSRLTLKSRKQRDFKTALQNYRLQRQKKMRQVA